MNENFKNPEEKLVQTLEESLSDKPRRVSPFNVSDEVKKEVNNKLWKKTHPGEVDFDRMPKPNRAD